MRVFGFVPFPEIVITDNDLAAVLEKLKSKVILTLCVRSLEWTLCKKLNVIL